MRLQLPKGLAVYGCTPTWEFLNYVLFFILILLMFWGLNMFPCSYILSKVYNLLLPFFASSPNNWHFKFYLRCPHFLIYMVIIQIIHCLKQGFKKKRKVEFDDLMIWDGMGWDSMGWQLVWDVLSNNCYWMTVWKSAFYR